MVFGLGWRYCYFYKLRLLTGLLLALLQCPTCTAVGAGCWGIIRSTRDEAGQAHIRRHRLGSSTQCEFFPGRVYLHAQFRFMYNDINHNTCTRALSNQSRQLGISVVSSVPHFHAFMSIFMHSTKFHCILCCCIPDLLHACAFFCILTYSCRLHSGTMHSCAFTCITFVASRCIQYLVHLIRAPLSFRLCLKLYR